LVRFNAHPLTAVLRALPLAKLDPSRALLLWNLISLSALAASRWIVQRAGYPVLGLAVTAMLWVSPIACKHDFLLLLVPLAVFWLALPLSPIARASFLMILVALWLNPGRVWIAFGLREGQAATASNALGVHCDPCYALLGLFALGVAEAGGNHFGRS
jgi:hypothetical protein